MTSPSKPKELRTWWLNCVGDIANGSDSFVVSGPWKETDPLKPIAVVPLEDYLKLQEQAEMLAGALKGFQLILKTDVKCNATEALDKYNKFKQSLE